jgi:thymidylate synthase
MQTTTTFEAWKAILAYVLKNGVDFTDENERVCREFLNLMIEIDHPEIDATRPITVLNSFQKWDYPGFDDIARTVLDSNLAPEYSYSYGPRLFSFQQQKNQVNDFIIPLLKHTPNSRRAVLTLWDPLEDSNPLKRDMPGVVMIDFKLRKGRLNLTCVVRSNDMFFGWPANVYQMHVLQQYVAEKLGVKTGSITTFSTSAHIFQDQFVYIKKILKMP